MSPVRPLHYKNIKIICVSNKIHEVINCMFNTFRNNKWVKTANALHLTENHARHKKQNENIENYQEINKTLDIWSPV